MIKKPILLGHRGNLLNEPENTLRSFHSAIDLGADGIELDIHITSDKHLVVIHDESIDRTSDGFGLVRNKKLAKLQEYNFGKGEKIPTLEEVLKEFGNKFVLDIEIKASNCENRLISLLEEYSITEKIILSSFNVTILQNLAEISDFYPLALIYNYTITDFIPLKNNYPFLEGVHPGKNFVNERVITLAHMSDLSIRPWTIDNPLFVVKLADLGVDAIITNDLLKTKKALKG
jgi:glycerophosphoryl diester phosphodiesterase